MKDITPDLCGTGETHQTEKNSEKNSPVITTIGNLEIGYKRS